MGIYVYHHVWVWDRCLFQSLIPKGVLNRRVLCTFLGGRRSTWCCCGVPSWGHGTSASSRTQEDGGRAHSAVPAFASASSLLQCGVCSEIPSIPAPIATAPHPIPQGSGTGRSSGLPGRWAGQWSLRLTLPQKSILN